jgi:hypothetical protein
MPRFRIQSATVLGSVVCSGLAFGLPARAQSSVAEAFYREGQRLLAEGNVHEACAKFAESQRSEPALGTLINLASCHEQEGKTASAWGEFTTAAGQAAHAGQHDREDYAKKRAQALEKSLHRLIIEVSSPLPNMEIKLDGAPLGQGALGTAMPLDPGEHEVVVAAPGKKMWSQRVQLGPGAVNARIEVPALEESPSGKGGGAVIEPIPGAPNGADSATSKPLPLRTIGFVGIGIGVAGIGVGAITGLMAMSKHSDLQKECGGNVCGPSHQSDRDSYYTLGTVSTVSMIAGGVLAGGGLVLVLTAPKPKPLANAKVSPVLGLGYLGARGSF